MAEQDTLSERVARTVYLPEPIDKKLVAESEQMERTTSDIIRECVALVFARHKDELRTCLAGRAGG